MRASSETVVALPADVDLHARPAATFVRAAMGFDAKIVVAAGDREADAKSLLSVLALGAKAGSELRLRAEGPDAGPAVDGLAACLAGLVETPA
jgi:phosphocarrier protein HPr